MDIIERLEWRYAVKKLDRTKILSAEKLNTLTEAFNLTATSYGLQPLKMVVIRDQQVKNKLVNYAMGQKQVADASHLLVICIEREIKSPYITNYFENVKEIRQTPDRILDPFKEQLVELFAAQTEAETFAWAKNQAYLALGNLLTVCAVEEIDACPMEGFEPASFDKELNLEDEGLRSVLILPVGYRSTDDMFSAMEKVRRPIAESVIFR